MESKIVTIEKQDHQGRGIAKIDGHVIFIPGTLAQEVCEIEIVMKKKKYWIGKVLTILKASPSREKVSCPHYKMCGGCQLLHQSYQSQLHFKEQKIKEIMKKFADINEDVIKPICGSYNLSYRNKVVLHIEKDQLGFYQEKTNTLIPITTCLLLDDKILEVMKELQEYIKINFGLTKAMIRVGNKTNQVMLSVEGKCDEKSFLSYWQDKVDSLIINNKLLFGSSSIISSVLDMDFKVSEQSFFQVNKLQTETLYGLVIDEVKKKKIRTVLDLYSGTGTIGLLVSPYVDQVTGIEVIDEAVLNANDNKKLNNRENTSFIVGKVEDKIDTFQNKIDLIIVDPPRSGLKSSVIKTICDIAPQSIIYVSCDPITLARDLKLLQDKYQVETIIPVDMFPNTYHVECVSVLSYKNK